MINCKTCGTPLPPERAEKYAYCTAPKCQEENARGLTIVAVGVNKAAEQFEIFDEHTRDELAKGKHHDQRRASFGKPLPRVNAQAAPREPATLRPPHTTPAPGNRTDRPAWTAKQERLGRLYREQGMRPDEIARRLGLSRYQATQLLLTVTRPSGRAGRKSRGQ